MKILFLVGDNNPESIKLENYFRSQGEELVTISWRITEAEVSATHPDLIVSYNYRFILKKDVFAIPRLGAINLHISYLPWNRGADPNFWSHVENTPSGVTVHYIDEGVDTGDIIAQKKVDFSDGDTLKTSYEKLHSEIQGIFYNIWEKIKEGKIMAIKQQGKGTFHLKSDKKPFDYLLKENGWNTLVKDLKKINLNHNEIHNN